jgi:hypothetical protein
MPQGFLTESIKRSLVILEAYKLVANDHRIVFGSIGSYNVMNFEVKDGVFSTTIQLIKVINCGLKFSKEMRTRETIDSDKIDYQRFFPCGNAFLSSFVHCFVVSWVVHEVFIVSFVFPAFSDSPINFLINFGYRAFLLFPLLAMLNWV